MGTVTVLALVDLVMLLITAGFGYASLRSWIRHRGFPAMKAVVHMTLQLSGILAWGSFTLTGSLLLAWSSFAVLTIGQVFGDLLMFASYRSRYPGTGKAKYLAVGGDVLSFRRRAPGFHALCGALAWFGMLAICVYASVVH